MTELSLLAHYGLFVVILTALSGGISQFGPDRLRPVQSYRGSPRGMSSRLCRARNDCIAGLALLTPAVFILTVRDTDNGMSLLAMQISVIALVIRAIVVALGLRCAATLLGAASLPPIAYLYHLAAMAPASM